MRWMSAASRVLVVLTTGLTKFHYAADSLRTNLLRSPSAAARPFVADFAISYDPTFAGLHASDFCAEPVAPLTPGGSVLMAGPDFIDTAEGFSPEQRDLLTRVTTTTGSGQKKNALLFWAAQNAYERVLFWDDDEYAVACHGSGDACDWRWTDVAGAHLNGHADVTTGYRTGFLLPVTPGLLASLAPATASALGAALAPVSDVIAADSFLDVDELFVFGNRPDREFIYGGNMSVSTGAVRNGRIPAFRVPLRSRGDDTIFTLGLDTASVRTVASGIFHDPFEVMTEVARGDGPAVLVLPEPEPGTVGARFARVLAGWLRYAPLLTTIRHPDTARARLRRAIDELRACEDDVFDQIVGLGAAWPLALRPSELLAEGVDAVSDELRGYHDVQAIWQKVLATLPPMR